MKIRTDPLPELPISRFRRMREVVDLDPPYQREGNVWKTETRAALIDSIINGLDIPKLYFERDTRKRLSKTGHVYEYSAIDGKQRLEAILAFIDGELKLPEDFWFFEDESVKAAGLTLAQLEESHSELASRFWDFELPIVVVTTDSGDLIEEMFQRLNASTSLNAAERRNSIQGPTRDAANALAEHPLLVEKSPIRSARYKYRELGAKFLAIENQISSTRKKIADTKAATLYDLFMATRGQTPSISPAKMEEYRESASDTLDRMYAIFEENDPLLRSIGTVVVYYIALREADTSKLATREALTAFESARRQAAAMPENSADYASAANARLREYNVWVQSTNDGTALTRRAEILTQWIIGSSNADPWGALARMADGAVPTEDESLE